MIWIINKFRSLVVYVSNILKFSVLLATKFRTPHIFIHDTVTFDIWSCLFCTCIYGQMQQSRMTIPEVDLYFYNSVDLTDATQCNYYDEKTFCEADFHRGNNQTGGVFSICHLNIRNMKKHLKNFDVYMKTLDYNFSLIGLSETWLQNQTCDLYHLEGYKFLKLTERQDLEAVLACLSMENISSTNVQISAS